MVPQPAPNQGKFFIQLGRFGDLLNIFPILLEEFNQGRKAILYVAEEFVKICDGISYADVRVFRGPVSHLKEAAAKARAKYPHALALQTWGHDWQCPRR